MADLILYVILAIVLAILYGIKRVLTLERRIAGLEGSRPRTTISKKSVRKVKKKRK